MWTAGCGKIPPLKDIYEKRGSKQCGGALFGTRKEGNKARQRAGYIRMVCIAIELLHGELSMEEIQGGVTRKNMHISTLGKAISSIFREMHVSDAKCITTGTSTGWSAGSTLKNFVCA